MWYLIHIYLSAIKYLSPDFVTCLSTLWTVSFINVSFCFLHMRCYLQEHGLLTFGSNSSPAPFIANSSSGRAGDSWASPSSLIQWVQSCAGLAQDAADLWAPEYKGHAMSGGSFGSAPSYPPTLTLMPSFLPCCFLSLGGGHENGVSFRAEHTTTTHCWYFDQFWASTLTTIHGCKKLFQGGLCAVLVGGENVPEGSLTTWLFCKYQ